MSSYVVGTFKNTFLARRQQHPKQNGKSRKIYQPESYTIWIHYNTKQQSQKSKTVENKNKQKIIE